MATITKNQHYIPQSMLANFANDKGQVFEALVNQQRIYTINYRQSMSERYVYEHPELEENALEKAFGNIETYFAPAMRQIISELDTGPVNIENIKKQVESYMRDFLIFYYRSGALLKEFAFDSVNESDKIDLMLEKIINSKYLTDLSESIISYYDFAIIKSEGNDFILSDQYVTTAALSIKGRFTNVSNRHLGLKDVLMLIPLSSKYYISYSNGRIPKYIEPNKVNVLSNGEVIEINNVIMNNSYVKCIAKNKLPLEVSIESFKYESPSRAIIGFKSGAKTVSLNKKEVFFYQEDIEQWKFFIELGHVKNIDTKRNERCKCGSGKKYKRCCLDKSKRNYEIVENMHKKDHYIKVRAHPNSHLEKALEEYSYLSKD